MSEKVELISPAELPVTEGNEVDVLCVENGELKRKEGASLGGGNVDLIIAINGATMNTYINSSMINFTEGSIDNVFTAFSEGRAPVVKLRFFNETQTDYCYYGYECNASVYRYGSELYVGYIYPGVYKGTHYTGYMRFTSEGVFEHHGLYRIEANSIE